jgi:hypothetical protein
MTNEELRPTSVDMASFERLVRVETKLDTVIESKTTDHADVVKELTDHESRLRILERAWWKTAGFAAAISAVIATGAGAAFKALGDGG